MSGPDEGDDACSSSGRRHQDERLLAAWRATGFHGPRFNEFVARFTGYAAGVLWKMVHTGEIWTQLAKIGKPRSRPIYWGEHDKEQLVTDSVTDGFLKFHQHVLVDGTWDPAGKASLNTLLVRYCLNEFADHYQAWQRQSLARLSQQAQRDPRIRGLQHAPSAERAALAKQAVNELSPEQFAYGAGYSHREIGDMFGGVSARAVEGRLYRARGRDPENGNG